MKLKKKQILNNPNIENNDTDKKNDPYNYLFKNIGKSYYRIDEKIQSKKIRNLSILSALFVALTLIFAVLFFVAKTDILNSYNKNFIQSVNSTIDLISNMKTESYDGNIEYYDAAAELNVARRMLSLSEAEGNKVKIFNELYSAFLKVPKQVYSKKADISAGLQNIADGKESIGYSMLEKVLLNIDYQDY